MACLLSASSAVCDISTRKTKNHSRPRHSGRTYVMMWSFTSRGCVPVFFRNSPESRRQCKACRLTRSARTGLPPAYLLPVVGFRDLPHEFRPGHVNGAVHGPSLRPRIILEDLHHQGGVVGKDHPGLQHAQETDLSFGFAESSGGIDGDVGVKALANGGDGGERRADFEGDAREDQLL